MALMTYPGVIWSGGGSNNSRIIQQQHNGVELFARSVISPERDDEVVEAVPRRLGRHDDELVFEAVSFGVLKAVVPAALLGRQAFQEAVSNGSQRSRETASTHLIEPQAAKRGFLYQQMAQGRRAPDVRRVGGVTFHIAARRGNRKVN